jgi:hypothetical protein
MKDLKDLAKAPENFGIHRDETLKQLENTLELCPFFLDVVLRRILLRVFAVVWLKPKHVQKIF